MTRKKKNASPPSSLPAISTERRREIENALVSLGDDAAAEIATPRELEAAKKAIAERADFNARYELGVCLTRLGLIYEKAINENNCRAALDATKERADLLKLYNYAEATRLETDELDRQESVVRAYLESTGVARKGLALEELARRVAAYVIDEKLPTETNDGERDGLRTTQGGDARTLGDEERRGT